MTPAPRCDQTSFGFGSPLIVSIRICALKRRPKAGNPRPQRSQTARSRRNLEYLDTIDFLVATIADIANNKAHAQTALYQRLGETHLLNLCAAYVLDTGSCVQHVVRLLRDEADS